MSIHAPDIYTFYRKGGQPHILVLDLAQTYIFKAVVILNTFYERTKKVKL